MKTTLYPEHFALKAKIVDFAGWQMPLHYPSGIVNEHIAVRKSAGMFDVSHMARVEVSGKDAGAFLDSLSTNAIQTKSQGSATYTVLPNAQGGSVDDVIICKEKEDKFFVVVNAGNRQKDLHHLEKSSKAYNVRIVPFFYEEGILAIQGPRAIEIASEFFKELPSLKKMHFFHTHYKQSPILVSRTGYTGSDGIEIFAKNPLIQMFWHLFLDRGVLPCGLGARDTLRQEMGYALYGHELSESISAIESVSAWTVKFEGRSFLGQLPMQDLLKNKSHKRQYGVLMQEGRIPRIGCQVFYKTEGKIEEVGTVTSGTFSPTLNLPVAIVMVEKELVEGDEVSVVIRDAETFGKVIRLPFVRET